MDWTGIPAGLISKSSRYSSPVHCLYAPLIILCGMTACIGVTIKHYKQIVTITHFVSDSVKLPC